MSVTDIIFLFLIVRVHSFNIDTDNPIVYVDPGQNLTYSSYFGYTIVLYPGSKTRTHKWIKIGAPRGQDPRIAAFKNPGVVYNCPLMKTCETVDVYKDNYEKKELLTNAWIGGAMDISYKFGRLSICAFRRIEKYGGDYLSQGGCYLCDLDEPFDKVVPLNTHEKTYYQNRVYLYGQGQAGFSVHYPTDEDTQIIGAPGVFNWAGTTIEVKNIEYNDPIASRRIYSRQKRAIQQVVYVADPIYSTVNFAYDLFGYAVTSGYFYGNKILYYAASTPKSNKYKGKVVIFQFNQDRPLQARESKIGSQFGEYFGASITAGDINSDGCDDLIVGAPYHAVDTYNEGSVYVFMGTRKGQLKQQVQLYGHITKGQFGNTAMFLGDINGDGYGDVAVGAPYEQESSGVVYIYRGSVYGLDKQHSQRIVGKDVSPEIRGFGISISRPADIDNNGYKDIAIGAHLSANAVLLRTKPIVVINYNMAAFPKELKRESKNFLIQVCYWCTHFNDNSVDINRTIVVDEVLNRGTIDKKQQQVKVIRLYRQKTACENITVSLKSVTNYDTPVTAFLSYRLVSQPQNKEVMYISDKFITGKDTFCVRCPILDESRSSRPSTINVPFTLDCGSDNICQANLSVQVKTPTSGNANTFVVGSVDYINLQAIVKNSGENAYSTELEILLPDIIFFRQIPSSCQEHNISLIVCNIGNPLGTNDEKSIDVNLDMKTVNKNNYERELYIFARTLTTSNNSNQDWTSLKLNLERLADITIYGKSGEQSLPFGNVTHGMPNFTQIYQVEKIGQSPLEKVLLNITIPYAIRTANTQVDFIKLYPPEGAFAGQPLMCKSDFNYIVESKSNEITEKLTYDTQLERRKRQVEVFNNASAKKSEQIKIFDKDLEIVPNRTFFVNCSIKEVVCSSITCYVGPFEKRQAPASVELKMMFDTQAISALLGTKDMILFSTNGSVTIQTPSGFVQSGNRPDSVDVSSLFINEVEKEVALWIIILSVIAGLLLLILIVYGLFKAGFFKRAKKEELKNLKAEAEQEIVNEAGGSDGQKIESPINASTEGLVDEEE